MASDRNAYVREALEKAYLALASDDSSDEDNVEQTPSAPAPSATIPAVTSQNGGIATSRSNINGDSPPSSEVEEEEAASSIVRSAPKKKAPAKRASRVASKKTVSTVRSRNAGADPEEAENNDVAANLASSQMQATSRALENAYAQAASSDSSEPDESPRNAPKSNGQASQVPGRGKGSTATSASTRGKGKAVRGRGGRGSGGRRGRGGKAARGGKISVTLNGRKQAPDSSSEDSSVAGEDNSSNATQTNSQLQITSRLLMEARANLSSSSSSTSRSGSSDSDSDSGSDSLLEGVPQYGQQRKRKITESSGSVGRGPATARRKTGSTSVSALRGKAPAGQTGPAGIRNALSQSAARSLAAARAELSDSDTENEGPSPVRTVVVQNLPPAEDIMRDAVLGGADAADVSDGEAVAAWEAREHLDKTLTRRLKELYEIDADMKALSLLRSRILQEKATLQAEEDLLTHACGAPRSRPPAPVPPRRRARVPPPPRPTVNLKDMMVSAVNEMRSTQPIIEEEDSDAVDSDNEHLLDEIDKELAAELEERSGEEGGASPAERGMEQEEAEERDYNKVVHAGDVGAYTDAAAFDILGALLEASDDEDGAD